MKSYEIKNIIEEGGFLLETYKTLWDGSDRSDFTVTCRLLGNKGGCWNIWYSTSQNEDIRSDLQQITDALARFPDLPDKIKFYLWCLLW